MKRENSKKEKKILLIIIAVFLLLMIISVSYAFLKYDSTQEELNVIGTECLSLSLVDESSAITLEKAYPLSDEMGKKTKPYTFTVKNNCNILIDYNINLEQLDSNDRMESKYVAIYLDNEEVKVLSNYQEGRVYYKDEEYKGVESHTLLKSYLEPNESQSHSLRLWIDESSDNGSQNKTFLSKVVIEGTPNEVLATPNDVTIKQEYKNKESIEDLATTNGYTYSSIANIMCEGGKTTCYFKTSKTVEVIGSLLGSCGIGDDPGDCIEISDIQIEKDTWYKIKNNIQIQPIEKSKVELMVVTCVGTDCSEKETYSLAPQDRVLPVLSITNIVSNYKEATIDYSAGDEDSGIEVVTCKYGLKEDDLDLVGSISNGKCKLSDFIINSTYYYAIEVIDKVGNSGKVTGSISSKEIVSSPTITSSSSKFVQSATIDITTPGVADSGINKYEYYISKSNDTPSSDATISGTTKDKITISEEGTWYVFYRTVSNKGNRSSWSGYAEVNIYYKASSIEYKNEAETSVKNVQEMIEKIKEIG